MLRHEKSLASFLSNSKLNEKLFNGYLYNTAELSGFSKTPLIGEAAVTVALAKRRAEEEKKLASLTEHEGKPEEKKQSPAAAETTAAATTAEVPTESTYAQYIYLIKINKNQIVEILFVLSTLLSGKRKTELQGKLLNFNFVNKLSALQKQIRWQPFSLPVFLVPAIKKTLQCRT